MKWLSLFLIVVAGTFSSFASAIHAQTADKVEIQSISHAVLPEAKETVTFTLSGPVTPKVFTIKGENPRLVLDFPGSSYRGKNTLLLPEGRLATAIRIGLHQKPAPKVRVVVDLAKDAAIGHTLGDYAEADRTLTVELAATGSVLQQKPRDVEPAEQKPAAMPQPSQEDLAAKPLHEKPVPPVLHRKEAKEEPVVQEQPNEKESPQLLDITFDDSSNKGEMVLFHLNDFFPPTVSAVEKDTPRVFCDFMEMGLGAKVQEDIAAKGKYVQRIRTTKHKKPNKVQVVLELAPDRDYDLQQVFFKNDNLFVLIVNELSPQDAGNGKQDTGDRKQ